MDPLSCLSVAGTAIQFIDFSIKIISRSWKVFKNGRLDVHAQAEIAVRHLRGFHDKLEKSLVSNRAPFSENPTDEEADLKDLCRGCCVIADDLIKRLDNIKTNKGHFWKSLTHAISSVRNEGELSNLKEQLAGYMTAINTHILGGLRNGLIHLSNRQSDRFDTLDQQTEQIIAALLDLKASLSQDIPAQISTALMQLFNETGFVLDAAQLEGQQTIIEIYTPEAHSAEVVTPWTHLRGKEAGNRKSVSESILRSLRFPTIEERLDDVIEAHPETFKWVFHTGTIDFFKGTPWSNFVDWLQRGDGIYWINGKAASGKSTLMKYMYCHPETRAHLSLWADGSPYQIAGFFFWNSGTKLQRSQAGLFRSLLYEVLSQVPDLIPIVFPLQWATGYAIKTEPHRLNLDESWKLSSLVDGFKKLTTQATIAIKLCLFIDGLDEYEGDDIDMAKLFKLTANLPHIKICASSRPHVIFTDAFHNRPQLRLQDLTRRDIEDYVRNRLEKDEALERLPLEERNKVPGLTREIVNSASGVFLWVSLVVTSLLNGIHQHDRLSDLRRRLKSLPPKLEDLYEHMIISVDENDKVEASMIFQTLYAVQSRDLNNLLQNEDALTIFGLHLAIRVNLKFALQVAYDYMTRDYAYSACEEMETRLRSRCGGLLEVSNGRSGGLVQDSKVTYLHRTVRDYLISPRMQNLLLSRTSRTTSNEFDPDAAMLKSYVLQLKTLPSKFKHASLGLSPVTMPESEIFRFLHLGVTHAIRCQTKSLPVPPSLIDELWAASQLCFQTYDNERHERFRAGYSSPLALAAQCGLHEYLRKTLSYHSVLSCPYSGIPLLQLGLNISEPSRFESSAIMDRILSTTRVILAFGADPNEEYEKGCTPWRSTVLSLSKHFSHVNGVQPQLAPWAGVLLLMLQHGADQKAIIVGPQNSITTTIDVISNWFHFDTVTDEQLRTTLEALEPKGSILQLISTSLSFLCQCGCLNLD